MNKQKKKNYEFKDEKEALPLVCFLNENKGSDLAEIAGLCVYLDDLGDRLDWSGASHNGVITAINPDDGTPVVIARRTSNSDGWLLYERTKNLINSLLDQRYHSESAPALHVQGRSRYYFAPKTNSCIDDDERRARASLEGIMFKGLISRLRVCAADHCKKWFFARKITQLCCSAPSTCRQRKYDRSPKARQRRKRNREMEEKPGPA